MVKTIKESEFEEEVVKSEKLVLLDFFADWCGPCKQLAPVFVELSEELTDLKFLKVDTQESPGLAQKFGVMSIPTLVLTKAGEEVGRIQGFMGKDSLKEKILAMISKD